MSGLTQKSEVLNHLKQNGSITSMEAFKKYGATRLSAIIFNLRDEGYQIDTLMIEGKTRYGRPTTFAKYILRGISA